MTDPGDDRDDNPTGLLSDLPIQPTGSGVADLEVAIEQAAVREGEAGDADPNGVPLSTGETGAAEAEAHPS